MCLHDITLYCNGFLLNSRSSATPVICNQLNINEVSSGQLEYYKFAFALRMYLTFS